MHTTTSYPQAAKIQELIRTAQRIVVLQADNPDADSLGSALAMEHILGDMGKQVSLYCGVHTPDYLHYMAGWDRVMNELPSSFELSIIVDTSADSLLSILNASAGRPRLAAKPCIVIDHHATVPTISYASVVCNPPAVAAGEVVYELARQLDWPLNLDAQKLLTIAIMSDSLGLTSEGTSARSIHIVAELVSGGVSIAELEAKRRELMRKDPKLVTYKGELLQRIEYVANGRIAVITIPWEEIERYSHAYNPSMLVIDDMRFATGVDMAIAFKVYKTSMGSAGGGKVTAKIRCNYGKAVADKLAEKFGGGGHPYASGFKIEDGRPLSAIKSECISYATELLDQLEQLDNSTV
jgi:phosphoesterase RecJ-like protein